MSRPSSFLPVLPAGYYHPASFAGVLELLAGGSQGTGGYRASLIEPIEIDATVCRTENQTAVTKLVTAGKQESLECWKAHPTPYPLPSLNEIKLRNCFANASWGRAAGTTATSLSCAPESASATLCGSLRSFADISQKHSTPHVKSPAENKMQKAYA